jgi:hypothetical protein
MNCQSSAIDDTKLSVFQIHGVPQSHSGSDRSPHHLSRAANFHSTASSPSLPFGN